jgi:hypothetical protein
MIAGILIGMGIMVFIIVVAVIVYFSGPTGYKK